MELKKEDLTKEEYVTYRTMSIFTMRKVGSDKIKKIMDKEDNK